MSKINTFQQLYSNTLILKKYGKDVNDIITPADCRALTSTIKIAGGTMRKFFGIEKNINSLSFQEKTLDQIAKYLSYESWSEYVKKENININVIQSNYIYPNVRFQDLALDFQNVIISEVNSKLASNNRVERLKKRYYESAKVSNFVNNNTDGISSYLNTEWYLYFFHEDSNSKITEPKFGRVVLSIGDTFDKVFIKNFETSDDTDYKGSVYTDKNKTALIFDLKTESSAKCLHLLVDINTDQPSEIALGVYSNLGVGGQTLISGSLVLELNNDNETLFPKAIGIHDDEFEEVDISIRKYLKDKVKNYHKIKPQIFSKKRLLNHSNTYSPSSIRRIKYEKTTKIIISSPKHSVSQEDFQNKRKELDILVKFLNEDLKLNVVNDILSVGTFANYYPKKLEQYWKRIEDSDYYFLFYYEHVPSSCLLEMAWAIFLGVKVHIFTRIELLPKIIYYNNNNSNLILHLHHKNINQAVTFIKVNHDKIFKESLKHKNIKLDKTENNDDYNQYREGYTET